jgi:hypothetical protein
MKIEKAVRDKEANALLEKAADCFDLAKTQQAAADAQHDIAARQHKGADGLVVSAKKLDALGHALTDDAVEIKGVTELEVLAKIAERWREK